MSRRLAGAVAVLAAVVAAAAAAAGPARFVLNVDLSPDFDAVDPALGYLPHTWQVEYATCLKLFNLSGRGLAATAVPEAAARMPAVSRDGRTYTFEIRPGFRFNTGEPLTAESFRTVLNRLLSPRLSSPAAPYFSDIRGARDVLAGRATSASGVTVPSRLTLRIALVRPVPDLVARLTLPYTCALPPGTTAARGILAPVPSAGPYFVSRWERGRELVLERNPHYRGPRARRPDEIRYRLGLSLPAQRLRVDRGDSDLGQFPPNAASELASRYGVNRRRFFVQPQLLVWFVALNRDRPLFARNDALARAVNFALDRRQLARQHGRFAGTPTDQILPAGLPGFRDAELYPLDGPRLAKARALARGRLRGGQADLWTFNISFGPAVAQVVQANLRRIGLDVRIRVLDPVALQDLAGRRGAGYDLMVAGWSAQYPDPFNFVNVLLSGDGIRAANNVNYSYFDEPAWNRRMALAASLGGAARTAAYASLDRDLMARAAPIAPYLTSSARIFVSARVGCVSYQPMYGVDLAAVCLRRS